MLSKIFCIGVLSVEVALASAMPPEKGLKMDIEVLHVGYLERDFQHETTEIEKRSKNIYELEISRTYYSSTLLVGSEREVNKVLIDTGSSDVWFMSNDVVCEYKSSGSVERTFKGPRHPHPSSKHATRLSDCQLSGSFNPDKSDTFHEDMTDPDFYIQYSDRTYARGIWGTDTITFPNSEVQMTFGVASKSSCLTGVIGLGPMIEENPKTRPKKGKMATSFIMSLKNAGLINKAVYSVYLNKSTSATGVIRFGVVDHMKYTSRLQTVQIVNLYKDFKRLDVSAIKLDNMYLENGHHKAILLAEPTGAILDSGASIQHFPRGVVRSLAVAMSGKYLPKADMYVIDCNYQKSTKIVYDFSGIIIKIPIDEVVIKRRGMCYLAAKSSSGTTYFKTARLGTNFLRNTYMVYDMEDMEISIAQASDSNEEDLEVVNGTVPRASKAPRYSSTELKVEITEKVIAGVLPLGFGHFGDLHNVGM